MATPKVKVWIVALVVAVVVILTAAGAWTAATAPLAELQATILYEKHRQAELEAQVASLSADASAAVAAADEAWAKAQAKASEAASATAAGSGTGSTASSTKSFTSYAFIKKMTGPYNETFTVYLDTFLILTGTKATTYAKSHGMKVPGNGILFVNADHVLTHYPLADTAKITAYTGGVEEMTPMPLEAGKLQQWVADPTIIPNATSDIWQVTCKKGVITTIKMVGIAD